MTAEDGWFRYWLPYQLQAVTIPGMPYKHVYLPLNRNYKPLGVVSRDWVEYEDYIAQAMVFTRDPHEFEGIWFDPEGLYLYDDDPRSRVDYFERLDRLLKKGVKIFKAEHSRRRKRLH